MAGFATARYAKLVARASPVVIKTEEDYDRLLLQTSKLIEKCDARCPEEDELLVLLAYLIEGFENKNFTLNASTPLSVLQSLMEARDLHPRDLWSLFGSRGITSEVLHGKRGISKTQAKKLAEFFHVSADLFI